MLYVHLLHKTVNMFPRAVPPLHAPPAVGGRQRLQVCTSARAPRSPSPVASSGLRGRLSVALRSPAHLWCWCLPRWASSLVASVIFAHCSAGLPCCPSENAFYAVCGGLHRVCDLQRWPPRLRLSFPRVVQLTQLLVECTFPAVVKESQPDPGHSLSAVPLQESVVLGFPFGSLIHSELVCVCGTKCGVEFISAHVHVQLSQRHLRERLFL